MSGKHSRNKGAAMLTTKLVKTYYYKRAVFLAGCAIGHITKAKKPMAFGIPPGTFYTFTPIVTAGHPLYTFGVTGKTVKAVLTELGYRLP